MKTCSVCQKEYEKESNYCDSVIVDVKIYRTGGELIKGAKCKHDDICPDCREKLLNDCKAAMKFQVAHDNYYSKLDKTQCCFSLAQFGREDQPIEIK